MRVAAGRLSGFFAGAAYLFDNLTPQTGAAAISSVTTFLDRIQAMREGSDPRREAERERDRAAVALLEQRRVITPESEAALRAALQQARQIAPASQPVEDETAVAEYQELARRFGAWLTEWRETARVVIKRRDHLIRLGLAERRSTKKSVADSDTADE